MGVKAVHAIVRGRVQGVFFRACTQEEAEKYGLTGWVRNLPDASVETFICGDGARVDRMVAWLHQGAPMSRVTEVIVNKAEIGDTLQSFDIRY